MTKEELEADAQHVAVVTALKVMDLECKVAMLGAALNVLQNHLQDVDFDEELEEAMSAAAAEMKAQQAEEMAQWREEREALTAA